MWDLESKTVGVACTYPFGHSEWPAQEYDGSHIQAAHSIPLKELADNRSFSALRDRHAKQVAVQQVRIIGFIGEAFS